MRPIVLVQIDKRRPAVILTRAAVRGARTKVTVAPITSRRRGLSTEVAVGPLNGLDVDSVINCDNLMTLDVRLIGDQIGYLFDAQEAELSAALSAAFALET